MVKLVSKYNYIIAFPKASWAGLICYTQQHYLSSECQTLEWSNSRKWPWATDKWLWRERLL